MSPKTEGSSDSRATFRPISASSTARCARLSERVGHATQIGRAPARASRRKVRHWRQSSPPPGLGRPEGSGGIHAIGLPSEPDTANRGGLVPA